MSCELRIYSARYLLTGRTLFLIIKYDKEHYETILDIPEECLKEVITIVKIISNAVKKGVNAEGISITQNNGKVAGQVVNHLHFHVIPRFKEDGLRLWPQGKYNENEQNEYCERIRSFL